MQSNEEGPLQVQRINLCSKMSKTIIELKDISRNKYQTLKYINRSHDKFWQLGPAANSYNQGKTSWMYANELVLRLH